jgi:hypothetical protein
MSYLCGLLEARIAERSLFDLVHPGSASIRHLWVAFYCLESSTHPFTVRKQSRVVLFRHCTYGHGRVELNWQNADLAGSSYF